AVTGSSAEQTLGNPPSPTESAQIPVMVRDSTGRPVRGLTASDFVVVDQSEKTAVDVLSSGMEDRAHEFTTYILIVIAPMEISGRAMPCTNWISI
ncbi:MAG TPA: hypothetical protein VK638_13645, partial [Edaphobacter sp.]|nr:hypothetical protein [Edaphobacter sp.]